MQCALASSKLPLPSHTSINAARCQHRPQRTLTRALFTGSRSDHGSSSVLDRPDFLTGSTSRDPQTESGWGASQGDNKRSTGGGHHRVIILDSERHTEELVVKAITTAIPGTSQDHAANCFHTARSLGMALVTTALFEIAEFYAQQLFALGVRATIEPDTTTL
jgi:ATP-dependent Clp protease adapter protein ClpS